jgi:peptidoglycan/xylan/chitin deacetylase (PgdA/CDA1 family)
MMHWLDPVQEELDSAPAPVDVFFRDDDAGWRDDRLIALLDLFEQHALPLDLAVIPAALERSLAAELRARAGARLGLHQHGFAHRNHEPDGRRFEFGPWRPYGAQRRDIEAGAGRLAALLGDVVQPIFTPPWNRCTSDTGRCLLELGFRALSRESRAAPLGLPGLRELPVGVDWCGRRHGVRFTAREAAERLAGALRDGGPVGVMFHHAVMDAADLAGAGELLALVAEHPRAVPRPMRELCQRFPPCPLNRLTGGVRSTHATQASGGRADAGVDAARAGAPRREAGA